MSDSDQLDWSDIKLLLAIVQAGSFGKAAESLGLTQSTVSRRVDQFEGRFGKKLFRRSSTGVELTSAGKELAAVGEKMQASAQAINRLTSKDRAAKGKVKIKIPDVLAQCIVVPRLHELFDQNPKLSVLFDCDILDLTDTSPDIFLQYMDPRDQTLLRVPVGLVHFSSFASKEYIEKHGAPKSLAEAASRRIVHNSSYYAHRQSWDRKVDAINVLTEDELIVVSNSGPLNVQAIKSGVGIGAFPTAASEIDGLIPLDLGSGGNARLNMYHTKEAEERNEVAVCKKWLMNLLSNSRWLQEDFLDPYHL